MTATTSWRSARASPSRTPLATSVFSSTVTAHVTAVCRCSYNQIFRVAWTTATHCCTASTTNYFVASIRCRTLPLAWSQAPVVVTTSHRCYGSTTSCQSVSESCSRSRRGLYTSHSLQQFPCTSLMTVAFSVGRRPLRSNSNDMRKLLVPRIHNKIVDRSLSAAGPRLWNDLPSGLRRPGLPSARSDVSEISP